MQRGVVLRYKAENFPGGGYVRKDNDGKAVDDAQTVIRHARNEDKVFWFSPDKHLPVAEFYKKIEAEQCYILFADGKPAGILRYNLFWDNTPFCNLLYVSESCRGKGYGKMLTAFWEREMKNLGYGWLLTSTRSGESAQDFYRAVGYAECGRLSVPDQPYEIFFGKFV